jgi:uncharacterized membrane protein YdjX (TVP38/TMEM64 family)
MTPERRVTLLRILSLVLVVVILAGIYFFQDHIQELYRYGYIGVFFVTLIANATVFLPIPGVAFVFAMGSVLHPALIALIGGLGAATGELFGYLIGFSGQGLAERSKTYDRVYDWMEKHHRFTDVAIMVFAFIPNPFFDAAGIAAGALGIPVWRFFLFCAMGSILKMMVFAYAGDLGIGWLTAWYSRGK